jgi:signal transduction histidine kinase
MTFHRIYDPERLHALIDAMLLMDADADLNDLLSDIVEAASGLVGARYGAMGVLAKDGETLARFITYGIDEETRASIEAEPRGRGLLGETIHRAQPLRIDNLLTNEMASGFPAHHPTMERFLGVPVRTGDGRIYGNLYLTDRFNGEAFTEEDELLVESFGRAAGLVIDQARLRSHLRELTLSEERERLARDLHDTIIQRLFGVGLALRLTLSTELDEAVRGRINSAIDELDGTIHEIRTTIFEIDQADLRDAPLLGRIAAITNEVGERLNVEVDLEATGNVDVVVGSACGHHAILALREILSNIVRHSNATAIRVEVEVDEDLIVLSVTDNGVGFTAPVGPGQGLRNLTSRARELGGDCVIDSEIGRGTLVRWTANWML